MLNPFWALWAIFWLGPCNVGVFSDAEIWHKCETCKCIWGIRGPWLGRQGRCPGTVCTHRHLQEWCLLRGWQTGPQDTVDSTEMRRLFDRCLSTSKSCMVCTLMHFVLLSALYQLIPANNPARWDPTNPHDKYLDPALDQKPWYLMLFGVCLWEMIMRFV